MPTLPKTGMKKNSGETPIFSIGPTGQLSMSPLWIDSVSEFCAAVKRIVGKNPAVNLWPYRCSSLFVAFDIKGEDGEVALTMIDSDYSKFPPPPEPEERCWTCECEMVDAVDAFYLAIHILKSLHLSPTSIFLGPRTIAK